MIAIPRFVAMSSPVDQGSRHSWCMTEIWLGPARVIACDTIDERPSKTDLESSLILDVWHGESLGDWFSVRFLCNCGKCLQCKPVSDTRIIIVT